MSNARWDFKRVRQDGGEGLYLSGQYTFEPRVGPQILNA